MQPREGKYQRAPDFKKPMLDTAATCQDLVPMIVILVSLMLLLGLIHNKLRGLDPKGGAKSRYTGRDRSLP
jgi:hypothetical protein